MVAIESVQHKDSLVYFSDANFDLIEFEWMGCTHLQ